MQKSAELMPDSSRSDHGKIAWKQMPKNPAAVSLGKLGGKARAEKLSPARRAEIASKAAKARWSKAEKSQKEQS